MTTRLPQLALAFLFAMALNAAATTHYVDLNSPSPTPPYISWATAAANIQDAIDAAGDGDLVLVTNGVYRTFGQVSSDDTSNRVAVTRPVALVSVNGSAVTTIDGENTMRCVYLTNGSALVGFTLTNGNAVHGGGVWCASLTVVVSNCVMISNSAVSFGGGAYSGTLTDSILKNNRAGNGGGSAASRLNLCIVTGNSSPYGGGAFAGALTNCTIVDNVAQDGAAGVLNCVLSQCLLSNNSVTGGGSGGGALGSSLYQCMVIGNHAASGGGGGAAGGLLDRCVVSNNVGGYGGGANGSFLNQSIVISNNAWWGGGAYDCSVLNAVIVGNAAGGQGGGTSDCILLNSIVYYNSAPVNTNFGGADTFSYSCTTPLPSNGPGCFSSEPLFVDIATGNFQLASGSPCINSGVDPAYWPATNATDYASQPRKVRGAVDVGIYEYQSPQSVLSYAWAQQFGLSTDGSADFTDTDTDGLNNYGEWRSDTIPTNALSALRMVDATNSSSGVNVTWQSVATRSYWLERATNLGAASAFQTVATNIVGMAGTETYTDTTATNGGPYFYRVGVQ